MEKQLRSGEVLQFSSDEYDLEAEYSKSYDRKMYFKIWFNGTYVHTSRTFGSFEKKLNQLIEDNQLVAA